MIVTPETSFSIYMTAVRLLKDERVYRSCFEMRGQKGLNPKSSTPFLVRVMRGLSPLKQ